MENLIQEIAKSLQAFAFSELSEETKIKALNAANSILYPSKQQKVIYDYHFSAQETGSDLTVTVFIKETEDSSDECWDLTIQGSKE